MQQLQHMFETIKGIKVTDRFYNAWNAAHTTEAEPASKVHALGETDPAVRDKVSWAHRMIHHAARCALLIFLKREQPHIPVRDLLAPVVDHVREG